MTTAWAHLPNAALIDEVLASVKAHPGKWSAAWYATWGAAWDAAQNAAQNAARDAARNAARDAVRDETWNAVWAVSQNAARDAAWGVLVVLIAYDDAGQLMKMPVEHLQRLYRIDPHPMYLLLRPAAIVFAED